MVPEKGRKTVVMVVVVRSALDGECTNLEQILILTNQPAAPAVTFPLAENCRPLVGTMLCCLVIEVIEARVLESLSRVDGLDESG